MILVAALIVIVVPMCHADMPMGSPSAVPMATDGHHAETTAVVTSGREPALTATSPTARLPIPLEPADEGPLMVCIAMLVAVMAAAWAVLRPRSGRRAPTTDRRTTPLTAPPVLPAPFATLCVLRT